MSTIGLSRQDDIAILTLHPEGKFNPERLQEFADYREQILSDDSFQALIITGQDKNFSQGLDLDYIMSVPVPIALEFVEQCIRVMAELLYAPIPTVAAINGHAFGLGAMITMCCDYRVMREDRGYICLPEVDLGMSLIPTMNALVCEKLPADALRDLLLTGARMGAIEAQHKKVIDDIANESQLLEKSIAIAQPMMGKNRAALSQLKRGINQRIIKAFETPVTAPA